ncbi:transmembrane and coiled-coil domains protein 1-like [Nannochloropsis oceanica]
MNDGGTNTVNVVAMPNLPDGIEALWLVAFAVSAALVTEALSYYFIYSKPEYQRVKKNMIKTAKALERRRQELKKEKKEKQEDTAAIELSNKSDKKCQRFEKDLKENARDMQKMQMLTTLLVGVSSAAVFYLLNRRFTGHVVAKLPFSPWKLVMNLSHRGLPGDDPTDCSMTFLFLMVNMGLKGSLSKLLGNEQPRIMAEINQQQVAETWGIEDPSEGGKEEGGEGGVGKAGRTKNGKERKSGGNPKKNR